MKDTTTTDIMHPHLATEIITENLRAGITAK
jgi:hypothetical protein